MIEADFVKRRRRSVSRNVSADVRRGIRLHDHRHRVPAHQTFDAAFHVPVARIRRLLLRPESCWRKASSARPTDAARSATGPPVFPAIAPCAPAPGFPAPAQKPIAAIRSTCRRCRCRTAKRNRSANRKFLFSQCSLCYSIAFSTQNARRQIKPNLTANASEISRNATSST